MLCSLQSLQPFPESSPRNGGAHIRAQRGSVEPGQCQPGRLRLRGQASQSHFEARKTGIIRNQSSSQALRPSPGPGPSCWAQPPRCRKRCRPKLDSSPVQFVSLWHEQCCYTPPQTFHPQSTLMRTESMCCCFPSLRVPSLQRFLNGCKTAGAASAARAGCSATLGRGAQWEHRDASPTPVGPVGPSSDAATSKRVLGTGSYHADQYTDRAFPARLGSDGTLKRSDQLGSLDYYRSGKQFGVWG